MSVMAAMISLIWAMDEERVIGIENRLPWKLSSDMKWFREKTMGKPILMGRKTFESFGAKPLPGRINIVLSRDESFHAEGITVVRSIEEALDAAADAEEVMVIGGASFYEQMLPRADRLYLTLVHTKVKGDTWFPQVDFSQWREVYREDHEADEKNQYPFSFLIYEK